MGKVPKSLEDNRGGVSALNANKIRHGNHWLKESSHCVWRAFISVLLWPDPKYVFLRHILLYSCHFFSLQKLVLLSRPQFCYISLKKKKNPKTALRQEGKKINELSWNTGPIGSVQRDNLRSSSLSYSWGWPRCSGTTCRCHHII